jgi:hypothetical protein
LNPFANGDVTPLVPFFLFQIFLYQGIRFDFSLARWFVSETTSCDRHFFNLQNHLYNLQLKRER